MAWRLPLPPHEGPTEEGTRDPWEPHGRCARTRLETDTKHIGDNRFKKFTTPIGGDGSPPARTTWNKGLTHRKEIRDIVKTEAGPAPRASGDGTGGRGTMRRTRPAQMISHTSSAAWQNLLQATLALRL